ncbi:MAG: polysaccharide lyase family 1 protein [Prevotella sp.]|nr:polysaccharide lyase family 1 protein [Prevotella sp.]
MKKIVFVLMAAIISNTAAFADDTPTPTETLNGPFGWTNCASLTSGDSYNTTGGNNGTRKTTLKSTGADQQSDIQNAIKQNDIVILDGSNGDFIVASPVSFGGYSNRTVVGINGARICTKFYLTEEMKAALDKANVKSLSSSSGTGGTLSNGQNVSEKREQVTRQTLIDLTGDSKESYRNAGIFKISGGSNIIIRNLKFVGPGPCDVGGQDLITCTGTTHLWVDHCEFTDGQDGNFDITNSADFVTVSWCTFGYTERAYDHMNTNLVGSSDSENKDKLNVTFAFNIWGPGCNQRMPMARAGNIHLLNNYYNCVGASATVNPRKNSEFLIEGNYFETGVTKVFSQSGAIAYQFKDNTYKSASQPSGKGTVTMPYQYTAIPSTEVPGLLTSATGAGATLTDPLAIGTTGIESTTTSILNRKGIIYNLSGQQVDSNYRGIIIKDGHKYIQK